MLSCIYELKRFSKKYLFKNGKTFLCLLIRFYTFFSAPRKDSKMQWERNQKMSQFSDPKWNLLNWYSDCRANSHLWKVLLPRYLARNVTQLPGGGYSPMNWRGCLSENFENTPKRYQNLVLWACHPVTNSFSPLRRTNSTTTNNITGTANFYSNKDNFLTLSSQGRFESIINLCPNPSF